MHDECMSANYRLSPDCMDCRAWEELRFFKHAVPRREKMEMKSDILT